MNITTLSDSDLVALIRAAGEREDETRRRRVRAEKAWARETGTEASMFAAQADHRAADVALEDALAAWDARKADAPRPSMGMPVVDVGELLDLP